MGCWLPPDDFASLTLGEAGALMEELAGRVREEDSPGEVRLLAGADAAYEAATGTAHAVVAVWEAASGRTVETAAASLATAAAYVPGFLAWRELPALLAAWERLERRPDLVLVDGHGRAHPRRCGLACLVGLALDVPAVGCAKTILVGRHGGLAVRRGASAALVHRGDVVGVALRTRAGVRPVYVSVGHRVTLAAAASHVLAAARWRIPEPLRAAHAEARRRLASHA